LKKSYDEVKMEDTQNTLDDFMTTKSWSEVYQSGRDCQWRDWQARRHGNAFDLYKKVTHVSLTGIGTPLSYPTEWVLKTPTTNAQYRWYYAEHFSIVKTRRTRYFYIAVSNCLPGKQISPLELSTKTSSNPEYAVENDVLVCANANTFCQGPLSPVRFSMSLQQNGQNHGFNDASNDAFNDVSNDASNGASNDASNDAPNDASVSGNSKDELSTEEYSIYICCVVLTVFYVPLILCFGVGNYYHDTLGFSKAQTNNTGKLLLLILTAAAVTHFMAIVFHLSYYDYIMAGHITLIDFTDTSSMFGRSPDYPDTLKVAGNFFNAFSNSMFVLVMVLIGKGKNITRSKISATGKMKIAIYLSVYTSLQMMVILWKTYMFDPALVLLDWESPPGTVLLIGRLCVTIWFAYSNFVTLRKLSPHKRSFFRQFCCLGSVWLLALPFFVLVCVFVFNTNALNREQIYYIADNVLMFIGIFMILCMWIPGAAANIFYRDPQKNQTFYGLNSGITSSYSTRNIEKQERKELLNVALRHAESLLYKTQRMKDESEDLTSLVDHLNLNLVRRRRKP